MRNLKLQFSIIMLILLVFNSCSKEDIRKNMFKKKDACDVVSFNYPMKGFKPFFQKELDNLGYPTALECRIPELYNTSEDYDLNIKYINPIHARVTGNMKYLNHLDPDTNEELGEPELWDESPITWEVFFDPYTGYVTDIIDMNTPNQDTVLSITYESRKVSTILSVGLFNVSYDDNGNIKSILNEEGDGMVYSYANSPDRKSIYYEPTDSWWVSSAYTIVEMLHWAPLSPHRERTTALGIKTFGSPGDYQVSYTYSGQQYNSSDALISWNVYNESDSIHYNNALNCISSKF
jgi:hypothetical protein